MATPPTRYDLARSKKQSTTRTVITVQPIASVQRKKLAVAGGVGALPLPVVDNTFALSLGDELLSLGDETITYTP